MAPVKTGYWDIRGVRYTNVKFLTTCYKLILLHQFHQPIRFLLAYAGVQHIERRYKMGSTREDTLFKSEWANEKHTLGLDFPNVIKKNI